MNIGQTETEQAKILPKIKEYTHKNSKQYNKNSQKKDSHIKIIWGLLVLGICKEYSQTKRKKIYTSRIQPPQRCRENIRTDDSQNGEKDNQEKKQDFESFGEYFSNGIANNFLGFDKKKTFAILNAQDKELEDMDDYKNQ